MKKIFLLLCLPLLLLGEDATIRMMSWNIWGNALKIKVKYILCVYFHPLYIGAKRLYHRIKGVTYG